MNRKSKHRCIPSLLTLLFVLSTAIGICSAGAFRWSKSPIADTSRTNNAREENRFACGIQRAISVAIRPDTRGKSHNQVNNIDDDESRMIRNAFIDDTEEAAEIKHATKPYLKNVESSERETCSVKKVKAVAASVAMTARPLLFWENMVSGAVSRSIAQTVMHPANTMKTIMQSSLGPTKPKMIDLMKPKMFHRLTCGAGANFVLSLPHGAFNFAVLEAIRERMAKVVDSIPVLERNKERIGPGLDFTSSSIATICCSVISTPQMMITDVSIMVYVSLEC